MPEPRIPKPIPKILTETFGKIAPPPLDSFIAGICWCAVDEGDQGDGSSLRLELPRHFIGHVAAKAITSKIIRSFGLKFADDLQIAIGHVAEVGKLFLTDLTPGFDAIDRLVLRSEEH